MMFGERTGFEAHRSPQLQGIDDKLRNRLYNCLTKALRYISRILNIHATEYARAYIVDKLGEVSSSDHENQYIINAHFFQQSPQSKWYDPYTILELLIAFQRTQSDCRFCERISCENSNCQNTVFFLGLRNMINDVLEEECSGYRLIKDIFVPLTNSVEINTVQAISEIPYQSVRKHIDKAICCFSDKATPDYENTIKDAISAVEAMCCIITGMTGSSATLGTALKKLQNSGIIIHEAMEKAFLKLYGYTSDAGGIRHGSIDYTDATFEDARYMLVTCSAFINFLIVKYEKSKQEEQPNEPHEI